MNTRYFLLVAVVFFFACGFGYRTGAQLNASHQNSLSNIPLQPHKNEVDVFFANERPAKPYYRVKMVEITAAPGTNADVMLTQLKQQAQNEGIDALLLSDIGKQFNTVNTVPSGDGMMAYNKLVGVGLKYRERIDYMGTLLKEQRVKWWPDENPDPKEFTMQFDFNGNNLSLHDAVVKRFFLNDIYPFETTNTLYAPQAEWYYKVDSFEFVFTKLIHNQLQQEWRCDYHFNKNGFTKGTIVTGNANSNNSMKFEMQFINDAAGNLIQKKLVKKKDKLIVWTEEIKYTLSGKPAGVKRYHTINGKQKIYFELENSYYTANDLPAVTN